MNAAKKKVSGIIYIKWGILKITWRPERDGNMKGTVFSVKQMVCKVEFINVWRYEKKFSVHLECQVPNSVQNLYLKTLKDIGIPATIANAVHP
jgi:hypothetical protein